jgi:HAD superfamily hydrolase (TIGR01509 family)
MIDAVIFDLDGVLLDSEQTWSDAREQLVRERGGTWRAEATRAMMGLSSPEWSRYLHDELGVKMFPEAISDAVVKRLMAIYREHLPLLPGASDAVASLASHWPLGLASSSNRPVIELVLDLADFRRFFSVTVSSEEVSQGKPAPDVYLEAARRLNAEPSHCVAVEDSTNGLRSAEAAEMTTIAIPNRRFPPAEDALEPAALVIDSIKQLRAELLDGLPLARS